jgi:hypothetical protein
MAGWFLPSYQPRAAIASKIRNPTSDIRNLKLTKKTQRVNKTDLTIVYACMVYSRHEIPAAKPLKQKLGEPFTFRAWRHTMSPAPETNAANPQQPPSEGRDASGRFAKGNAGGPGNPYPRRVAALRQALLECVTEDDIRAIAKAVIEEAKGGNIAAAKIIFQYTLGKPDSAINMDLRAPISNGAGAEQLSAPKANGSNGGRPSGSTVSPPSGLGKKADQWLDRQVRGVMDKLGKEPLL